MSIDGLNTPHGQALGNLHPCALEFGLVFALGTQSGWFDAARLAESQYGVPYDSGLFRTKFSGSGRCASVTVAGPFVDSSTVTRCIIASVGARWV